MNIHECQAKDILKKFGHWCQDARSKGMVLTKSIDEVFENQAYDHCIYWGGMKVEEVAEKHPERSLQNAGHIAVSRDRVFYEEILLAGKFLVDQIILSWSKAGLDTSNPLSPHPLYPLYHKYGQT